MSNRKMMAAKNVFSAVMYYVVNSVIGFVNRKVFTVYLGSELLGLNGLVVSVISMLSLLELGVASSIGYSLYKPLKEENYGEVKAIMQLFSKLYRIIGLCVGGIGLAFIPFLPYLIETTIPRDYVIKVYLIFLADAVLSYFLAYRRTILVSAQKDYINKNADTLLYTITGVLQIVIICVWQNYLASLLIKLVFTVINNLYLYLKAGKMFPYLTDAKVQGSIEKEVKDKIAANVKALFIIKIASYCVVGTDNLLLSAFADLTAVAVYSGYTLIIGIVNNLFNRSFGYITANIGNYLVSNEKEGVYALFQKMNFMNYLITSYTTIAMLTLFNEFISGVWLGEDYIFPTGVVALLVCNNYLRNITQCADAFRNAAGLYSPRPFVKYLSLLEGIVNLVMSVILAYFCKLGIVGVFLGTTISTIISIITIIWIVYRFLFEKKMSAYFAGFFGQAALTVINALFSLVLFRMVSTANVFVNLVFGVLISFFLPFGINFLVFGKTEEWKYSQGLVENMIRKVIKRG